MQNEWIVISEYCDKCHIEPTFIDMLCESGLIDVEQEGGERYLPFSELPDVERYSRMYYDLSINMEGRFTSWLFKAKCFTQAATPFCCTPRI